ncbi:MAG: MBL fold metallo-hydrolase, partial [Pseudobdellovibrionaceae bacterium]
MKISRILHAGYIFQSGDTQIAFDPIFENPFSRNCFAFPNVEFDHRKIRDLKLDAVFISHYHDDHCSLESLNLLDRQTPIYIYCLFDELFAWIRQLGFKKVYSLKLNSSIVVGEFEITPRRALDADVDSLFHIKAAGLDVLNVVDSWIDLETLDLLKQTSWDLILWPFQTMREIEVLSPSRFSRVPEGIPPEWIEQLKELKPKNIVPSSCQFIHESWSWYNQALFPISYIAFAEEVEEVLPETKIIRLDPSLSICLSKNFWERSASLDWIFPIGNQDVDYDYQMDFTPQPISEIAKHFD